MTIKHLKIVSIPVNDQEAAKRFYREVLGFEVVTDQPFVPGTRWIELAPAGAQTTITLVTWFENMKPGGLTGLVLETVRKIADDEFFTNQPLCIGPFDTPAFAAVGHSKAGFVDHSCPLRYHVGHRTGQFSLAAP